MKPLFRLLTAVAFAAAPLLAAIDGTVINKTTGKPQPGVALTLVKPGQGGMRTLGTAVSDANGRFVFQKDEPGGGPQLLQANYGGINYNKLLTPNIPTSGVELPVYEATAAPEVARIAQHMLVLEPTASQISVNETVILQNNSSQTFKNDSTGELQFYLPPAANGQVRVNAQSSQGMPLPRPAEKTKKANIFRVDFPIKPGETEFQIAYVLPVGAPFTFRGQVVNLAGMIPSPLRLVAPSGVTLAGADIQQLGVEPSTQAAIFNVVKDGAFSFDISGTGTLHNTADNAGPAEDESPQVTEGNPAIYTHRNVLLTLTFCVLAVGLLILYRTSPVRS